MVETCGIKKASAKRVWHANGVKPHFIKTFELSHDPAFMEKLADLAGRYMNPFEHALE